MTSFSDITGWLRQRFETSRATAGVNVRSMEGMRGFAVLLVFLTHFCTFSTPWTKDIGWLEAFVHPLHAMGNAGVDLFFVLSGYVIYKSLIVRAQPFGEFMGRRIQRIYPTFLVVFAIYLVLSFVFPAESNLPAEGGIAHLVAYLIENLLLLPGLLPIKPLFVVAWSLSYEMFFYLVLPLLVALFRLCRWDASRRLVALCVCTVLLAACCLVFELSHMRMVMFLAGMLLHEALAERRIPAPGPLVAGLALGAALLAGALPDLGLWRTALLFAGFFLMCLDCFQRPAGWLARAFGWTPLRWLGNMSYSFYLVHGLFLRACFLVLAHVPALTGQGGLVFFGMLPLFFLVSLAGSALLFLTIERPLSLEAMHGKREAAKEVLAKAKQC